MTKTYDKIAARRDVKSGEPEMMPLGAMAEKAFVCVFEFGSRAVPALARRVRRVLAFV